MENRKREGDPVGFDFQTRNTRLNFKWGQLPHVELRSLQCGTGFRVLATLERTHFSHTYILPLTLTEICACFSFALTIDTRVVIA